MGWDSKPSYPPSALYTITIRCTDSQRTRWENAAKRYNRRSRGAFVAWAADMAVVALEAYQRVTAEHAEEMKGAAHFKF